MTTKVQDVLSDALGIMICSEKDPYVDAETFLREKGYVEDRQLNWMFRQILTPAYEKHFTTIKYSKR